jgi:uncharacterized RDD family membrane protein YckC
MIYIWNINGLKSDLAERRLSGADTLIYLACILAVQGVSWVLAYPEGGVFNLWDNIETIGFAVFLIVGSVYCYYTNGGRKGGDFMSRYISLAWVFGVRYTVVVLIPLSLVLYTPISMFTELPDNTQWYDTLFYAILRIPFYLVLSKHIKDVALNRLPAEDEIHDIRDKYPEDFDITKYPPILRRYPATFIDAIFILFLYIILADILQGDKDLDLITRILVGCSLLFLYEPILTSRLCTIGQKIMGIRVRHADSGGKISILNACIRIVVKLLLGAVSFFSIPVTRKRRGLHDFAAGSVVVKNQGNARGLSNPHHAEAG